MKRGAIWALCALAVVGSLAGCDKKSTSNAASVVAKTTTTESLGPTLAPGQSDRLHPSGQLTPGAVFSGVTVSQVCTPGYSASVRDVTSSERDQVFAEYHLTNVNRSDFEVDHLISLELGGSNDIQNLWPEPLHDPSADGATDKDKVENKLHDLVCNGSLGLSDAQAAIVHWDSVDVTSLTTTTTTTTEPPTTAPPTTAAPRVTVPPDTSPPATQPPVPDTGGPTALCNDGTYSYAAHHQGACSHHGGVAVFYK